MRVCPNCASTELTWQIHKEISRHMPAASHNRLGLHDVNVVAALGCLKCSETVMIRDVDAIEDCLNGLDDMIDKIDDYRERCRRARDTLRTMATKKTSAHDRSRYGGKREGVGLALDYLRAFEGWIDGFRN